MTDTKEQLSQLLREASETHHRVFRIVDGADDDWASWYAWWLINLSELPTVLDATPVRSELIYLLVNQNKQYTAAQSGNHGSSTMRAGLSTTSTQPTPDPPSQATSMREQSRP